MEVFYTYFLKVNIALAVLYVFYRVLFSNSTFFHLRRVCLFFVYLFSFIYPFINLFSCFNIRQQQEIAHYFSFVTPVMENISKPVYVIDGAGKILLLLYAGVTAVFLVRFFFRLGSIFYLLKKGEKKRYGNISFVYPHKEVMPFSFFKWIVIRADKYSPEEFDKIWMHEKAHQAQWHSLDILMSEGVCIILWLNPFAWLLKRAVAGNLEFLADRFVLCGGHDRKAYQYLLLSQALELAPAGPVNRFTFSSLKTRISMMNKRQSGKMSLLKYLMWIPVAFFLLIAGNTGAMSIPVTSPLIVINGEVMPANYDLSQLPSSSIEKLIIRKDASAVEQYGKSAKKGVIEIVMK